ncbi:MAG: glycoside hydrolase family 3 C-terminal domain-containing protein [Clostridiales bacterium]|nr:glycoside hydrolase family 3 C-terminal domain-containing protein [Clostridiales bacterium]
MSNGFSMTKNVNSIGKPATYDYDSDLGVINAYSAGSMGLATRKNDPGKNQSPPLYLDNGIVGATRNKKLCLEYGVQWGEDCLWAGYQGLYGTGANIHRSPYLGRTYGYFSEDPTVTGLCVAQINIGMESKGSYMLLKHCVLNEQECNRCGGASWANEQTIREVYLKAFQIAIERGGVQGVMTSLNRIGATPAPHHPFINEILRGEFGMQGYCVTDSYMGYMEIGSCILAGNDLPLAQDSRISNYEKGYSAVAWAMREAAHNILYSVVNSSAMNGITSNVRLISFEPEWKYNLNVAMPIVAVFAALIMLLFVAAEVWRYFWKPIPEEYFEEEEEPAYSYETDPTATESTYQGDGAYGGSDHLSGGDGPRPVTKPNVKKRKRPGPLASSVITTSVLGPFALAFAVFLIVGNLVLIPTYDVLLTVYFGYSGGTQLAYDTNQYFERKTTSLDVATGIAQQIGIETEGEGAVLMKNENKALPLADGAKVSLFSISSVDMVRSVGGGSGASGGGSETLKDALAVFGVEANPTLWNYYRTSNKHRKIGGLAQATHPYNAYNFEINEIPYSQYPSDVLNSYSAYGDAAIVVIGRTGCENGDLPRSMSVSTNGKNTGSLLELDADERALLQNVRARFNKVIVLLNTTNVINCGFLDEYNVDACLWVGGVGYYGMLSVAGILAGKLSPSGRLADTHVYDVTSAPAVQNFGNFEYVYNGTTTEHHYVTYSEGIYVGYQYYETRYEDKVLGRGNAGNYDYSKEVAYPFGYGLSYTNFIWNGYSAIRSGDEITVKVSVTNNGNRPGKDVVEVYVQSPYTQYDIDNKVEKSAVKLVQFGKTKKLQPGEKQELTIKFNIEDMKSYDQFGKGTYILEGSDDYYVTAASNAHTAINNILAAKGKTTSDGMDGDGDKGFTTKLKIEERVYDKDTTSGNAVGNLFEDCDGSEYYDNIKYLSRNDWSVMDNNGLMNGTDTKKTDAEGSIYSAPMSAALKQKLETIGYAASGAPDEEFSKITTGAKNGLKLIELKDLDFNDPKWEELLDQATVNELVKIASQSAYGTPQIDSVAKPHESDIDGPQGFKSFIGDNVNMAGLPVEVVVASTWNQELAYRVGDIIGELCLWLKMSTNNLTGWYAPAMNIHRTPFGGRNSEYYSECGMLSGIIGANVVKGASDRGVMTYIKHFALNDQERNRMTDNVTWSREQAIREVYLKPFEMSIKYGGSKAVMTSYNRIGTTWAGGNYNLLTGVLRKEWGFNGFVLTDYMDGDYENIDQMLAAGGDGALNPQNKGGPVSSSSDRSLTYLRRAMHHCLYAVANSNAMNGIDSNSTIDVGTPKYYTYLLWINIGVSVLIVLFIVPIITLWVMYIVKKKRKPAKGKVQEMSGGDGTPPTDEPPTGGMPPTDEQPPAEETAATEETPPAEDTPPTEEAPPAEEAAATEPIAEQAEAPTESVEPTADESTAEEEKSAEPAPVTEVLPTEGQQESEPVESESEKPAPKKKKTTKSDGTKKAASKKKEATESKDTAEKPKPEKKKAASDGEKKAAPKKKEATESKDTTEKPKPEKKKAASEGTKKPSPKKKEATESKETAEKPKPEKKKAASDGVKKAAPKKKEATESKDTAEKPEPEKKNASAEEAAVKLTPKKKRVKRERRRQAMRLDKKKAIPAIEGNK